MKKVCSFILRNMPTMEKRVKLSSSPLGISKQKPMKRTLIRKTKNKKHNRKDLIFNKVVAYLISDSYMYNPLVSPQPTFDFPPPKHILTSLGGEEDVALPIGGRNKKLIEKVVDFLEADCYLYSPLLANEHASSKNYSETPTSGKIETGGRQLRSRPKVVAKTVAYRESVKHMVHQNGGSKPVQGASLETESRKMFVK